MIVIIIIIIIIISLSSSTSIRPRRRGPARRERRSCAPGPVFAPPFFRAPFPCLNADTLFSE